MKSRHTTIDVLRVIGLVSVIMAHCSFSDRFTNIINFGVPMLMLVSGMSFQITYHDAGQYSAYVKKRFHRLILPVWLFLIFFFIIFKGLFHDNFNTSIIIRSFLLMSSGIMFIWVYRVFFTSALLNPFMKKLADQCRSIIFLMILFVLTVFNDALYLRVIHNMDNMAGDMLRYILTYTIGYAIISASGILFQKENKKIKILLLLFSTCIFMISGCILHFPALEEYKHPPMLYYMSYGGIWTFALYLVLDHFLSQLTTINWIAWLSKNCMNIYLWHAFFYYLVHNRVNFISENSWLMLIILLGGGIAASYIQEKIQILIRTRTSMKNNG